MELGDGEVQDEYEEKATASKQGVGIGWSPNTTFDRVDAGLLFDDHFCLQSTI